MLLLFKWNLHAALCRLQNLIDRGLQRLFIHSQEGPHMIKVCYVLGSLTVLYIDHFEISLNDLGHFTLREKYDIVEGEHCDLRTTCMSQSGNRFSASFFTMIFSNSISSITWLELTERVATKRQKNSAKQGMASNISSSSRYGWKRTDWRC